MSMNLKAAGIFSFIVILLLAVTTIGFSNQQRGKMHQKGMMGMMGQMDNLMGQCNKMMMNMDKMMMQQCPDMMGMMNMRGMMMRMNNMSQHIKYMMEHMNSLMMDEEYQKDDVMKSHIEEVQECLKNMTDSMQKAMEIIQKMAERASELQREKK